MKTTPIVKLGDVATRITSGITPRGGESTYLAEGPVMLIRSQNVQMNFLDRVDVFYISHAIDQQMERSRVEYGDVLFNITGASIGRVATFEIADQRANVNQHVCIIRPRPDSLNVRYLAYFMSSPRFQSEIKRLQHGGTRQAFTYQDIRNFPIPLPPLPEQKRLAAILDQADAVRRKRRQASRMAADLVPASFFQLFGDVCRNTNGYPVRRLADVADLDRGKSRHRPRDAAHLYGGPYPFIQTGDITNSDGRIRSYSQTYSEAGLAQSRLWPAGTLCITIAANIADTAILTFDACFPDSVVGLIPSNEILVEYVQYWLVAMKERIEDFATQVAQKNINLQLLRNLTIPVPPRTQQQAFADALAAIRQLRDRQTQHWTESHSLFRSLTEQAFRGEI